MHAHAITGRQPAANSAHHRFLAAVTGCWAQQVPGPSAQLLLDFLAHHPYIMLLHDWLTRT
jgi:hypothetical protein